MIPDFEKLAWNFPCPYCKVGPGVYCRVKTSRARAQGMHAPRTQPFRDAFSAGYAFGWQENQLTAERLS